MQSPYIGREVSWLRFNERVLEQARDKSLPPLERMKYIEIAGRNLDEFFMVRIGGLMDRLAMGEACADARTGRGPGEVLDESCLMARGQLSVRDELYAIVASELAEHGIVCRRYSSLSKKERRSVAELFRRDMLPLLSPQVLDSRHPFPHMENLGLYILALLKNGESSVFGLLPVPRALERLVRLPGGGFMLCEEILLHQLAKVFRGYKTEGKCVVRVTRSADIDLLDDLDRDGPDFAAALKKKLKKRERLSPVRLEFYGKIRPPVKKLLATRFGLRDRQIYSQEAPLGLDFSGRLPEFAVPGASGLLSSPPHKPVQSLSSQPVLGMALGSDILLAYPYDSMVPLIRLIAEAAEDPCVLSVKITLYRLSESSQVAAALCAAAENGKEVTAILELRARFDERSNIGWAKRLEEAGCRVIYGPEGFKVHAKMLLITRRKDGRLQTVVHIGTGNFNELTARQYTDFSLITARPDIGGDAVRFFQNIPIGSLDGDYRRLLVAPGGLKKALIGLVDAEIARSERGEHGEIFAKMNALTDRELIDKLLEASRAEVGVRLLVRGICCISPGIPGLSENIEVKSVVGRFLEHSRVFWFGPKTAREVYLSSADWMTRNTERRVEVAVPVQDPALRTRLESMMELMWRDNVKAWRLMPDGTYSRLEPEKGDELDAQERLARRK